MGVTTDFLMNDNKELEDERCGKEFSTDNSMRETGLQRSGKSSIRNTKKLFFGAIICAFVVCVVIIVAFIYRKGVTTEKSDMVDNKEGKIASVEEEIPFSEDTNAIARAEKSVVKIHCFDYMGKEISTGSGFVSFNDKTVVTNYHVIEGAASCKISTSNDEIYDVASIYHYSETYDIAILGLTKSTGLGTLTLGVTSEVKKGDPVIAIGSPLGITNTVSQGIISGRVTEGDIEVLQFTAAISNGSSGGALFDNKGEVIGVTFASFIDGQNLNLAIPIKIVSDLYDVAFTPIDFDVFYQSRYNPKRQVLTKWIVNNGQEIDYILMPGMQKVNGYYVHYYNDKNHYYLEYHDDTNTIRLLCQSYSNGATWPNLYTMSLSNNSVIASFSAFDVDAIETGEILVRATGEFDITTFNSTTYLYCIDYDAHNESFGVGKPWYEFEPIYRSELCGALDWVDWLLTETCDGMKLSDIGFLSY